MTKTTIHQLDANGNCWREFTYYDRNTDQARLRESRIERAYKMSATMVTVNDEFAFGNLGTH